MAEEDLYRIGEVAAMLGVSAHTIRAWERRHGILHPERTLARQRRYRSADIDLLRDVKRAIDLDGMSIRLAFQMAVEGSPALPAMNATAGAKKRAAPLFDPSQGVWRAVGDLLPQMIMLVDLSGRIVEVNTAAARTFGTLRQKLAGRKFASTVEPWDRAKAVLLYRPRAMSVDSWELNLATAKGPRLYSFQAWPVGRDGDEDLLALIGSEMYASPALRPPA